MSTYPPAERYARVLLFLVAFIASATLWAATPDSLVRRARLSSWALQGSVGINLPDRLLLLDQSVEGLAQQAFLAFQYRRRLPYASFYQLAAEGMLGYRRGTLGGAHTFTSRTARAGISAAVGRHFAKPRLNLITGVGARTAVEPSQFELRRQDNLRLEWRLAAERPLYSRLQVNVELRFALRSYDDADYLADPRQQLHLGLRYRLTP